MPAIRLFAVSVRAVDKDYIFLSLSETRFETGLPAHHMRCGTLPAATLGVACGTICCSLCAIGCVASLGGIVAAVGRRICTIGCGSGFGCGISGRFGCCHARAFV
jgi:hypothetical protein